MKQENNIIVEVEFEDQGQDFLTWTISFDELFQLGEIVDCRPFQYNVWGKYFVLSGKPQVGGYVTISKGPEEDVIEIKYPVNKITTLEDAANS